MKYAYPQDPTHAVSAIRRYDESSDSATSQSSLERQQDIAVVGETVPFLFCHRFDWGGSYGTNGGVWISPRLIQLGITETDLSMMYLLSQGKVTGASVNSTYWGYQLLRSVDSSATMQTSYESVPSNLDLDYDPGGSLSWTTTNTSAGPNLNSNSGSFNTADKCIKMVVTFSPTITVEGSGTIIGGESGTWWVDQKGFSDQYWNTYSSNFSDAPGYQNSPDWNNWQNEMGNCYNRGRKVKSPNSPTYGTIYYRSYLEFQRKHKQASWSQTSRVRYNYAVINTETNQTVKSGTHYIVHGSSSTLTIDNLPAAKYRLEFSDLYKERDKAYSTHTIPSLGSNAHPGNVRSAWDRVPNISGPPSGYQEHTNPGSETQNITSTVVQTLYNQIDFPDLPGGDQQVVGGLSDLTMMGIRGDVLQLRPQEGPDYFLQSHIFLSYGAHVK